MNVLLQRSLLQELYFETQWAKEGRVFNNLIVEAAGGGFVVISPLISLHDPDSDSDSDYGFLDYGLLDLEI